MSHVDYFFVEIIRFSIIAVSTAGRDSGVCQNAQPAH